MAKKAAMKNVLNCFVIIAILISAIQASAFVMNGDNTRNSVSSHSDSCVALSTTVIYVPDDYPTIQAAVDAASSGNTIIVREGTYNEDIDVNRCITLQGENRNTTIIDTERVTVKISCNSTITGFTIKNGTYGIECGPHHSDEWTNPIAPTITNNIFTDLGTCILAWTSCATPVITNNEFIDNYHGCIWISSSAVISNNTFYNNGDGIFSGGGGIDTCIFIVESSSPVITGNLIINNSAFGIVTATSPSSPRITSNIISGNEMGILDWGSSTFTIFNNTITDNEYGVYLSSSTDSIIYFNNFIGNVRNAYSSDSTNLWHSSSKITYTYNGNTYTSYVGNYWDDYSGTDASGDGLGDIPYNIDSESDNYPLMDMFENYRLGDGEKRERVIAAQITAGADDGFVARTPEYFSADSKAITIGTDLKFAAFLRFSDLKIPANATITKADIAVVPTATNQAGPMVHISAADAANPSAPTTSSDFYARERTASFVNWDASSWDAGESENSNDISSVIQELVNSYDYSAGAPILIFLDITEEGTENQYFAAFEDAEYEAPKLFIEYSTGESTGDSTDGELDITPPLVTIISPEEGKTYYGITEIALEVTANEPISRWSYRLNGADPVPFVPSTTIAASIGDKSLVIYAEDNAGNVGSASVSFKLRAKIPI
jgi:parallel beta-helix repeat protein